ncbi:serine hydrolase domain-containing protein [Undibacterium arcticum]|uniref:serine hydrolase domain-containing protein n=1 Tax=Undibacterium arcticum TaxID=1762892 RepID=UPI003614125F
MQDTQTLSGCFKALRGKSRKEHAPISRYMTSLLLATACAGPVLAANTAEPVSALAASASELPRAWPEQVGVDSRQLVRLSEWIRKENLDVRSLLVIKDGKLIFERYSKGLTRDHNYELYSITKGVTALSAGILMNEGRLSLDDKVSTTIAKFRPDLKDSLADKKAIELRHLLAMSSGLFYDFKPKDDPIYYGAPDRLKLAANTSPKIAPGKEFEYTDVNPISLPRWSALRPACRSRSMRKKNCSNRWR